MQALSTRSDQVLLFAGLSKDNIKNETAECLVNPRKTRFC